MPALLARSSLVLLLLLLVAPQGLAQKSKFDPQEDLEGYLEANLGDYSDLYDFAPFDGASGKRLGAGELKRLRADWAKERGRVGKRIAAIESDPKEGFLYATDRRLNRSAFFRSIDLRRVDTHDPVYFYVEAPARAQKNYEDIVAGQLGPWANELERIFREEYVKPQGLEQRAGQAAYAIVVLATEGSYIDYAKAVRSLGLNQTLAHYDPDLLVAITYRDAFGAGQAPHLARRPILHELVHALQHAYSPGEMPGETWFNEGLAEYLSYHLGHEPPSLRDHPLDRDAVRTVATFTQTTVSETLLPLDELCEQRGYNAVVGAIRARARNAGFDLPPEAAMTITYAQSGLWMHYLHHGEEGKHREAVGRYVKAALAGRGGKEGLLAAFGETDLAALRRGYMDYVRAAFGEMHPGAKLADVAAAGARPVAAGAARAPFDASTLAPPTGDPELALACALVRARDGAYAAAAGDLKALLEGGTAGELDPRVRRELERLDGMVDLRRRFFEQVARKGKKLKLRRDDAWLIAKVEAVEEGRVVLGSNRLKVSELALEELDGMTLVKLMRDSKYGFDAQWLMAYPYALAGNAADGERFLDASPGARALAADAADLAARMNAGELVVALQELSTQGVPEDPAAARAAFDVARRLLVVEKDLPFVAARREALTGLARAALEEEFGAESPAKRLNATKVEELAGDRLRITYAFDDRKEALDFAPIDGAYALDLMSDGMRPTAKGELAVRRGALRATGLACSRHVLPLADVSLRFTVAVHEPWTTKSGFFQVGLADDGFGNYASCIQLGSLLVIDKPTSTLRQHMGSTPDMILGRTYHVALENDGKTLVSKLDGREIGRTLVAPRTSGSIFLSVASESPVEFRELVIEGRASEEALAQMRDTWVLERLQEAGIR